MATTVNSDLVIYDELVQTSYLERRQEVINIFNQNGFGALTLTNEAVVGDYSKSAFYKIGGSVAHRDVNSTSTVTPDNIDADEMVDVKVPWKYGPYAVTEESFKRRGVSPTEFSALVGVDMADAVMENQVELAMGALQGAIGSNSNMIASASISTDGKKALTKGMRKFGDRAERIAAWVMDSSTYFDFVDQAIENKIFEEAGLVIYGGTPGTMGKPVLVTDKAPEDVVFGLQSGAVRLRESQAPGVRSYDIDDQENLAIGFRGEGVINVGLMGYSWDTAAGGANPAFADLANTANWDKYATSDKLTAGVLIDLSGS